MNSLLTTLEIVAALARRPSTADELESFFSLSTATLKRHLAEARHLGADIQSVKLSKVSTYHLRNADQVAKRLSTWIELERSRYLTS